MKSGNTKHRILERREEGKIVEFFNDPKETCPERNNVILLINAADLHGVGLLKNHML